MRKVKFFVHCTLLATTPSLLAYPEHSFPQAVPQTVNWLGDWWWGSHEQTVEWVRPTTYDEIMQMLKDLESGELERRYPPEQLERVNEYLATLAKEGILPNEFNEEADLEEDSYDLLYGEDSGYQLARYLESSSEYRIIPAVHNGYSGYNIVQCSKISKSWKKTKKYVKKHKKAIIIGAVVVVAVAAVTVAVVVASSAGAASAASTAAGAAGVAASSSNKKDENHKISPEEKNKELAQDTIQVDTPVLQSTIESHISTFKEYAQNERVFEKPACSSQREELSFEEHARNFGAFLAHETLDGVYKLTSIVPQLNDEIKEIGTKLVLSESFYGVDFPRGSATDEYKNLIASGHQHIDEVFSTNQADYYTQDRVENEHKPKFSYGVLPPPGNGYTGKKGWELKNPVYQPSKNTVSTINGRVYRGHAIDQMQNRGIPPSVVEHVMEEKNIINVNQSKGTIEYYDAINKVKVIANEKGEVVTVIRVDRVN